MTANHSLLADIPGDLPEELVQVLAANSAVRIERIVSRGHRSPEGFWYDQDRHEFVLLVAGRATLVFEDGREIELRSGDYVDIKAHVRHRVAWTDDQADTVWLAVFYGGC